MRSRPITFLPLTKFGGGLKLLHEAGDDAVTWLESTATAALATCDDGLVRAAGDGDVAVLDDDEVVSGRGGRVRELVALVHLGADDRHLDRALDHHVQRAAAGARRHHHERARLTCTHATDSHGLF